eukprot:5799102-Pleurochrysis_carterae.AAC.2
MEHVNMLFEFRHCSKVAVPRAASTRHFLEQLAVETELQTQTQVLPLDWPSAHNDERLAGALAPCA